MKRNLISTGGKDLVDLGELGLGSGGSLGLEGIAGLLLLVVGIGLGPALVLELLDEVLVLPSDLVGEITEDGVVADGVEADDAEGGGDYLALDTIIWVGNSLESGKAGESVLATGGLLMTHATDGAPDHAGWAFEMKWPSGGIGVVAELAEIGVLDLLADKGARNADLIATDDDDLLAGKELLGNDRGKATKKVVAAVDNDSLRHLD